MLQRLSACIQVEFQAQLEVMEYLSINESNDRGEQIEGRGTEQYGDCLSQTRLNRHTMFLRKFQIYVHDSQYKTDKLKIIMGDFRLSQQGCYIHVTPECYMM